MAKVRKSISEKERKIIAKYAEEIFLLSAAYFNGKFQYNTISMKRAKMVIEKIIKELKNG